MQHRFGPIPWPIIVLAIFCGCSFAQPTLKLTVPYGNAEIRVVPIDEEPYNVVNSPPVIAISPHDFITGRNSSSDTLFIEEYNDTLGLVWSSPLELKEASIRARLHLDADEMPEEHVIRVMATPGHLIILTYVKGENDSLAVIGRLLDTRSGGKIRETLIMTDQDKWLAPNTPEFRTSIAPDSSKILVYRLVQNNQIRKRFALTAVVDTALSLIKSGIVDVHTSTPQDWVGEELIDNAGGLYIFAGNAGPSLYMLKYEFPSGDEIYRATILPHAAGGPDGRLQARATMFANDSTIVVIENYVNGKSPAGISFLEIDATKGRVTTSSYLPLSPKDLDSSLKASSFDDAVFHTILCTPDTAHRFLVFLEQHTTRTSGGGYDTQFHTFNRESTYHNAGNILVAAFGSHGNPAWQHVIVKEGGWSYDNFNHHTFDARVTGRNTTQIACRFHEDMLLIELGLADGREQPGARAYTAKIDDRPAFNLLGYTTWLADDNLILTAQRWSLGGPWFLMSLKPTK